ncbi:Rqc2 family fibronectin-binding protein [Paenibacillus sp. FSL W7-1287]|uniref:Rqc2 family fibronectin-binding protein n=1 Tax=Paenibacillus sp. FSL W7-1287 TaxID=2954538 RepID=UPI0030F8E846
MALDGIVIKSLVDELQQCIGARIHKIHQPTNQELVFGIRGNGMSGKLLLSANPTYPRVHFTNATYINPLEAPMFCMLMRKYCEGGVIERITQVGRERIIHIDVRHRDEVGDTSFKRIIVELMGRHSNIILIDPDTNTVHDGIQHVTPAVSSYRIVMPGSSYTPPPEQNKLDPLAVNTKEQFTDALHRDDEQASVTSKTLVGSFSGFSPLLANEIIYRAITKQHDQWLDATERPLQLDGQLRVDHIDDLWSSFKHMMETVQQQQFRPMIVKETARDKQYFSVVALTHIDGSFTEYRAVSEVLEAFYGDKAERDTVKQRAGDLIRFVTNEISKNEQKLVKLQHTYDEAQDADRYRIMGELITAYMHQIKRGDESVDLVNYYDENGAILHVLLDPQLTPSENAQRYFKRYTKQKNSQVSVMEQIELTNRELEYFSTLLQQLELASLSDIEEIREELVAGGYLRERVKKGAKRKKSNKPQLLCYTSSEGIDIYVGKNNLQNEYVTNRLANSNDTWLHTKDIPGSHVVIRSNEFGNPTLEEAAMLAAYYSQAKSSSMVPVDYTLIRHVKKPSGAKPGFVIYDQQKTVYITPDEEKLKALPHTVK